MLNNDLVKETFYFDNENLLFFNHGMNGICPKEVMEEKFRQLQNFEKNPNFGFCEMAFDDNLENTKLLAERMGVLYHNLSLLPNVTTGFSSVFKSINFLKEDEILITNFIYPSINAQIDKNLIQRHLDLGKSFESNEDIVSMYIEFVNKYPKIKYAIIEHIPSFVPLVQPVEEITRFLKSRRIIVMIDGANAPGQLKDLNVGKINADIYIADIHKWCFVPRGTAFIAIQEDLLFNIKTPIYSYLETYDFFLKFQGMGTIDITNFLCIKAAFGFIDKIGGLETIHNSVTPILRKAITYLESAWNVKAPKFPEMAPFTRIIPLPQGFEKHDLIMQSLINKMYQRNYYKYTLEKLQFVATIFNYKNKPHFRLSCHIYNNFEQFVLFADRVLQWLNDLDNGDFELLSDRG